MITRRQFLAVSAGLLATGVPGLATERRKRIAFLGTEVRRHSHAQHFLDRLTRDLFVAPLTRSRNLPVEGAYPTNSVTFDWARRTMPDTLGYLIEHRDGFRTSILLTDIRDFKYAGNLVDTGEILSCQMYLPMPAHGSTTADSFNPLTRHIVDLILTDRAPCPAERALLTSGMVMGGIESLFAGQEVAATPEMAVEHRAPEDSLFWRV